MSVVVPRHLSFGICNSPLILREENLLQYHKTGNVDDKSRLKKCFALRIEHGILGNIVQFLKRIVCSLHLIQTVEISDILFQSSKLHTIAKGNSTDMSTFKKGHLVAVNGACTYHMNR